MNATQKTRIMRERISARSLRFNPLLSSVRLALEKLEMAESITGSEISDARSILNRAIEDAEKPTDSGLFL